MPLHCINEGCGWKQDDFWSEEYSPLHGGYFDKTRALLLDQLKLPPAKRYVEAEISWADERDIPYTEVGGKARILTNEYLVWEMEQRADQFRAQVHWTEKDFKRAPRCCPQCGSGQLSTDAAEEPPPETKPARKKAAPKKKATRKKAAPKKKAARKKAPKKKHAKKKAAPKTKAADPPPAEPAEQQPTDQTNLKAMSAEDRQRALQRRVGI